MTETRPRPRRQPDPETDLAIARHQHQEDALDAIDRADSLLHGWRAALAAGNPSIAVIRQISCEIDRALTDAAQMVGIDSGAAMTAAAGAAVLHPRFSEAGGSAVAGR